MEMAIYEFVANMIGWVVAVTTLGITLWRDRRSMRRDRDESVRQSQKLLDKIENLSQGVTKMEVTLTTMTEREDDYGRELMKCSTKLREHEKRIARIEANCDWKKQIQNGSKN